MMIPRSLAARLLAFGSAVFAAPAAAVNCADPVATAAGPVTGYVESGVCAYAGIPYAAPPTGERRWQPPAPPAPWTAPRAAERFGPWCMQTVEPGFMTTDDPATPMGEDCLYLNVWRPRSAGIHPVMVWFHGGGLVTGSGSLPMYRGDRLAAAEDVVVITVNYRLAAFGFFALPDSGPEAPAGNQGFLDQIAALEWVRDNVAAFGGDPQQVTIFGNSAGGWSVCNHLVSPLSRGLFSRAIIESGGCDSVTPLEQGRANGQALAAKLGCSSADAPACLRRKTAAEILAAATPEASSIFDLRALTTYTWFPASGTEALPEPPLEALAAGRFARVPLLAGTTRDEGKLFTVRMTGIRLVPKHLVSWVVGKSFGPQTAADIERLYPYRAFRRPLDATVAALGDAALGCKCRRAAELAAPYTPVYVYRFDYDDHRKPHAFGAAHGLEVPFVLGNLDRPTFNVFFRPPQREAAGELSAAMMRAWAAFARTGNPASEGLPDWPAYRTGDRQIMVFDLPLRREAEPPIETERCAYWSQNPLLLYQLDESGGTP